MSLYQSIVIWIHVLAERKESSKTSKNSNVKAKIREDNRVLAKLLDFLRRVIINAVNAISL